MHLTFHASTRADKTVFGIKTFSSAHLYQFKSHLHHTDVLLEEKCKGDMGKCWLSILNLDVKTYLWKNFNNFFLMGV